MKDKPRFHIRQVVLLRHGESTWNKGNLFTGWTDVDLSDRGRVMGQKAGHDLKEHGLAFDLTFTSVLKRAIRTLWLVLDEMELVWIPVHRDWRLNERHYGSLQGLNEAETAKKLGETQVKLWRRSYDIRPPALEEDDPRHPRHDHTMPAVRSGKRVLIVAHGNSLRALVKHLDGASDADIAELNIPTGIPLVYEVDNDLAPIRHYCLGDAESADGAMQATAGHASPKE